MRHAQLNQGDAGAVAPEILADAVGELLEMLVLRGMARIRLTPVNACTDIDDLAVDPVVRRQVAATVPAQTHVANAWHDSVDIGEAERLLLPMMDGSVDRSMLVDTIAGALRDGRLQRPDDAGNVSDPAAQAETMVATILQRMREAAVFVRQPD